MKPGNENGHIISERHFCLDPGSIATPAFEEELIKNNIWFTKHELFSSRFPVLIYHVLEKDLRFATSILDSIEQDVQNMEEQYELRANRIEQERKRAKRQSVRYRRRTIAGWITILTAAALIGALIAG